MSRNEPNSAKGPIFRALIELRKISPYITSGSVFAWLSEREYDFTINAVRENLQRYAKHGWLKRYRPKNSHAFHYSPNVTTYAIYTHLIREVMTVSEEKRWREDQEERTEEIREDVSSLRRQIARNTSDQQTKIYYDMVINQIRDSKDRLQVPWQTTVVPPRFQIPNLGPGITGYDVAISLSTDSKGELLRDEQGRFLLRKIAITPLLDSSAPPPAQLEGVIVRRVDRSHYVMLCIEMEKTSDIFSPLINSGIWDGKSLEYFGVVASQGKEQIRQPSEVKEGRGLLKNEAKDLTVPFKSGAPTGDPSYVDEQLESRSVRWLALSKDERYIASVSDAKLIQTVKSMDGELIRLRTTKWILEAVFMFRKTIDANYAKEMITSMEKMRREHPRLFKKRLAASLEDVR